MSMVLDYNMKINVAISVVTIAAIVFEPIVFRLVFQKIAKHKISLLLSIIWYVVVLALSNAMQNILLRLNGCTTSTESVICKMLQDGSPWNVSQIIWQFPVIFFVTLSIVVIKKYSIKRFDIFKVSFAMALYNRFVGMAVIFLLLAKN